ncbi:MAG: MATE family efflux transporter [Proteobacteria bacterium]|nr:MATE family efflux transporter [Pseudomonadota bacterium]
MSTDAATLVSESRWRSELRATLALSWPLVLTSLAQNAMTTTDVVMMGWLGGDALAAGALGANLIFMPLIFGIGLVSAISPMIAKERGRNRFAVREIRRTFRQGLWAAAFVSVPVGIFLWHGEKVLLAMGQDPDLSREAGRYLRAIMWEVFPFLSFIVLRSLLSALERPRWALAVVAVAVLLNAFLNWVLMFGNLGMPALGIVGSGIATSLSATFMFLALALVFMSDRKLRRYHIFGRWWRADWPRFRALMQLGLPIALTLFFEVSIFNAAVFLMGLIGKIPLAAHSIVIQIAAFTFMVPLGIGQAVAVRVGLAYGARDPEGIRVAGWTAFALGVGFMGIMALVLTMFPKPLIGIFLDFSRPESEAVLAAALGFIAMAALFQLVDGAQAVAIGMLRGLHDARVPMLIALFGYWGIGLPLGALLAFQFGMGGVGIWTGLATGLTVVAILLVWRWTRREALVQL